MYCIGPSPDPTLDPRTYGARQPLPPFENPGSATALYATDKRNESRYREEWCCMTFTGFCSRLKTELYNRTYGGHTAPS